MTNAELVASINELWHTRFDSEDKIDLAFEVCNQYWERRSVWRKSLDKKINLIYALAAARRTD